MQRIRGYLFGFIALFMLLATNALAVHAIKKPLRDSPHVSTQKIKSDYEYYAYIDTSYNYLVRDNIFTNNVYNRLFDIEENGFTMHQLGFSLAKYPKEGLGGHLMVIAGVDANYSAPSGWNPYFGSQTLAMYPYEADLQYAFDKWIIKGGAILSLVGRESDESDQDLNFSRSILAYAQPGTNIGVRAIYEWSNSINLYFGIGNGLSTFRNAGQLTMVEAALRYDSSDNFTLGIHASNGPRYVVPNAVSGLQARFSLLDVVAEYTLANKIKLAANADYYVQDKGRMPNGQNASVIWDGITGYISYDFDDQWRLAGRAEVFADPDGFAFGIIQSWREATVTLQYMPRDYLILRAETRRDFSNVNSFVNSNGIGSTNNQQSFAIEGIYLIK